MVKIVTIVGARPQFIKAAPVSKAFQKERTIQEILVHTGQHYDQNLSNIFFKELKIPKPKYQLGVGSGSHAVQTGKISVGVEKILLKEKPDLALVYGDTNSTLAGALAAAKVNIPIAHVEAGLRSFNRAMPEEINRIVTDTLSAILFVPNKTAVKNLKAEGLGKNVYLVGDVMLDAAKLFGKKSISSRQFSQQFNLTKDNYFLLTIHRAENTDNKIRLSNILKAMSKMAQQHAVIFPIHPRTKKSIKKFRLTHLLKKISILPPLGFLEMISLESNADLIITDSGGIQKEAYFHKVPCVTLRDQTEWVETVKAGWNRLVKVDLIPDIIQGINRSLNYNGHRKVINEYGNGNATKKILKVIKKYCTHHHLQ